jgi:hypothetical protein
MSPGSHNIQITYNDGTVSLFASASVTVQLINSPISVLNPPATNPTNGTPTDIVINTCGNSARSTNYTINVQTTLSTTNVFVSFSPPTTAFAGGMAVLDTNFSTSTTLQWDFSWTNVIAGTWTIRADGYSSAGDNTAYSALTVQTLQIEPTNPNSDDSDNDGISDYLETTPQALPSTSTLTWNNSQVHLNFLSGKTNPNSPDTDGDGLPDGLELGVGPTLRPPTPSWALTRIAARPISSPTLIRRSTTHTTMPTPS